MFARSLLRTGVRPFTTTAVRQDRAGNSVAISELYGERTLTLPSLVAPPHSSPVPTLPFSLAFVFVPAPFLSRAHSPILPCLCLCLCPISSPVPILPTLRFSFAFCLCPRPIPLVARVAFPFFTVAKANGLLDLVPGNSLLTKTGVVATGVGVAAVAISKEYLLLHPETIVLGAFAGMVVFLHQQLSPVVANELDTRADDIRKQLNVAGEQRKASLLSEIEATKGTTEVVAITKELFAITKDVATLQAQIRERELRRAIGAQFKAKLDYIAQLEAQKRILEQQKIVDNLRARISEAIQDPKFQTAVLTKCISDIESLAVAK